MQRTGYWKHTVGPLTRVQMLTLFGTVAVTIMFLSCWLEPHSQWSVLVFAEASAATHLMAA